MQKQTQEKDDVNADAQANACDSRGTDWRGAAQPGPPGLRQPPQTGGGREAPPLTPAEGTRP